MPGSLCLRTGQPPSSHFPCPSGRQSVAPSCARDVEGRRRPCYRLFRFFHPPLCPAGPLHGPMFQFLARRWDTAAHCRSAATVREIGQATSPESHPCPAHGSMWPVRQSENFLSLSLQAQRGADGGPGASPLKQTGAPNEPSHLTHPQEPKGFVRSVAALRGLR